MPSQRIQKNFGYMFQDFAPVRNKNGRPLHIPSSLQDEIRPTVDALGTSRWADIDSDQDNAPNQTRVFAQQVPLGIIRVYLYVSVFHADALNSHIIGCTVRSPTGANVAHVVQGVDVVANQHVAIERTLMVGQLFTLVGTSLDATGAGNNLSMRVNFIDIPLGSYLFLP